MCLRLTRIIKLSTISPKNHKLQKFREFTSATDELGVAYLRWKSHLAQEKEREVQSQEQGVKHNVESDQINNIPQLHEPIKRVRMSFAYLLLEDNKWIDITDILHVHLQSKLDIMRMDYRTIDVSEVIRRLETIQLDPDYFPGQPLPLRLLNKLDEDPLSLPLVNWKINPYLHGKLGAEPGDWSCSHCHEINHRGPHRCIFCNAPFSRPYICKLDVSVNDWCCSQCHAYNFNKDRNCFRCRRSRSSVQVHLNNNVVFYRNPQ